MKRRKTLALNTMRELNHYWKSMRTSIATKMRILNAYVAPIAIYNAYLWSMNNTRNGEIDAFQRRLLRYAINIKHPRHISNDALYEITKAIPWSKIIVHRRLSWFGHLMRLPAGTPVRKALQEAETPVKLPRGRPKTTWLECMKEQLRKDVGAEWECAKAMAADRKGWKGVVNGLRPQMAQVPGTRR